MVVLFGSPPSFLDGVLFGVGGFSQEVGGEFEIINKILILVGAVGSVVGIGIVKGEIADGLFEHVLVKGFEIASGF